MGLEFDLYFNKNKSKWTDLCVLKCKCFEDIKGQITRWHVLSLFLVIIFIYPLFLNDPVDPVCLMENFALCSCKEQGELLLHYFLMTEQCQIAP